MTEETEGYPGAGRELDALVAQKVFGYGVDRRWYDAAGRMLPDPEPEAYEDCLPAHGYYLVPPRPGESYGVREVRHYSTDIAAAWEVVEKLWPLLDGGGAAEPFTLERQHGGNWFCHMRSYADPEIYADVEADTAPHAICLAALEAVATPTGKDQSQ